VRVDDFWLFVCDWFPGSIRLCFSACFCVFDSIVQVVIYSLRLRLGFVTEKQNLCQEFCR